MPSSQVSVAAGLVRGSASSQSVPSAIQPAGAPRRRPPRRPRRRSRRRRRRGARPAGPRRRRRRSRCRPRRSSRRRRGARRGRRGRSPRRPGSRRRRRREGGRCRSRCPRCHRGRPRRRALPRRRRCRQLSPARRRDRGRGAAAAARPAARSRGLQVHHPEAGAEGGGVLVRIVLARQGRLVPAGEHPPAPGHGQHERLGGKARPVTVAPRGRARQARPPRGSWPSAGEPASPSTRSRGTPGRRRAGPAFRLAGRRRGWPPSRVAARPARSRQPRRRFATSGPPPRGERSPCRREWPRDRPVLANLAGGLPLRAPLREVKALPAVASDLATGPFSPTSPEVCHFGPPSAGRLPPPVGPSKGPAPSYLRERPAVVAAELGL